VATGTLEGFCGQLQIKWGDHWKQGWPKCRAPLPPCLLLYVHCSRVTLMRNLFPWSLCTRGNLNWRNTSSKPRGWPTIMTSASIVLLQVRVTCHHLGKRQENSVEDQCHLYS
jgi:hypothetical protein